MSELLFTHALERLGADARVFRALLDGVSEEQARWKPDPARWSLLEVVCHLADEERDDFRERLARTLRGEGAWPPIDPPGWAVERRYNDREPAASLADFLEERERSLTWLRGLDAFAPEASHEHPRLGVLTAGDLLASWVAHDLIHIRQMTRLNRQWLERLAAPASLDYAGPW